MGATTHRAGPRRSARPQLQAPGAQVAAGGPRGLQVGAGGRRWPQVAAGGLCKRLQAARTGAGTGPEKAEARRVSSAPPLRDQRETCFVPGWGAGASAGLRAWN